MNKLRSQYLYQLLGTIQQKKSRWNLARGKTFYQLHITCENLPKIEKIFAFDDKLTNPQIWTAITEDNYLGHRYLLKCRNYQGHYYLVDWKLLTPSENPLTDHDK